MLDIQQGNRKNFYLHFSREFAARMRMQPPFGGLRPPFGGLPPHAVPRSLYSFFSFFAGKELFGKAEAEVAEWVRRRTAVPIRHATELDAAVPAATTDHAVRAIERPLRIVGSTLGIVRR